MGTMTRSINEQKPRIDRHRGRVQHSNTPTEEVVSYTMDAASPSPRPPLRFRHHWCTTERRNPVPV